MREVHRQLAGRRQAILDTDTHDGLPPLLHHRRVSAKRVQRRNTDDGCQPALTCCEMLAVLPSSSGAGPVSDELGALFSKTFGALSLALRVRRTGGRKRFSRSSYRSSTTSSALLWMTILTFAAMVLSSSACWTP